jgi:hypothetical protein
MWLGLLCPYKHRPAGAAVLIDAALLIFPIVKSDHAGKELRLVGEMRPLR